MIVQFRKFHVLAVVSFWSFYLAKGNKHGPPKLRKLSRACSGLFTPWQTVMITLLYLYISRNFDSLLDLECPEPLANLYTRSYFRATWVTTALDAGFWTAMRIRRKWLRDLSSIVFSLYYLIAAERADEKVRKVRGMLTLDHLRASWNKGNTPYLKFVSALLRPRLMKYPPRAIRIPRPGGEPVQAWLYFDGPLSALKDQTKIVLDVPGGGFVAMDPRAHDDKLIAWAGKTGLPVLSLDYKKAPEYPYPYALNECFDVYRAIIASRGRLVGLSGEVMPKIVICGDSAGGNLATGTVLKIIEHSLSTPSDSEVPLPMPEGLVLIYPGLDFNIVNWMSEEHMSLFKDRRMRKTNRDMLRLKSMQYNHLAGTPHHSEGEDFTALSPKVRPKSTPGSASLSEHPNSSNEPAVPPTATPTPGTRLAITSMISYINDRILDPATMRSMILLYVGPHNRPSFSDDYYLSPILAPPALLARFPKTYFLTGERDPLVDDTVIFAGRLRKAKAEAYEKEKERGQHLAKEFDDRDVVEVALIPGISHGFMQFAAAFPEGWNHIFRCARWIDEIFELSDSNEKMKATASSTMGSGIKATSLRRQSENAKYGKGSANYHHNRTESSGDEALEMRMPLTAKLRAEQELKERLLQETLGGVSDEGATRGRRTGRDRGRLTRKKSSVSLASEDDLLGRRMLGLVSGLTSMGEGNTNSDI
ncbi:hypothetical protein VE02_01866 [Pseudogymnoascus sp. 03VT05]|nr:hypothetical protein VE02_01866 [Pseudogymnoascus sp. 03VT05]